MAAITAALIAAAATAATVAAQRNAARKAHQNQMDQQADARQQQEDAKTQQDATLAARAQRQQQLSMSGGGYDNTIGTSPLGLSSPAGLSTRSKLGE